MCLREGDVVENEVRDLEGDQIMQCFEAVVKNLGMWEDFFLGDVPKKGGLTVGVSA